MQHVARLLQQNMFTLCINNYSVQVSITSFVTYSVTLVNVTVARLKLSIHSTSVCVCAA